MTHCGCFFFGNGLYTEGVSEALVAVDNPSVFCKLVANGKASAKAGFKSTKVEFSTFANVMLCICYFINPLVSLS